MKTFNYHSAKDVKEASKLSSSNSAFLAGGMTTLPSMKLGLASYKDIIDIKRIKKLSGIKVSGKTVRIGSTTKHVEVANSKDVKKAIPSLAALAEGIGDPQVRNRGTIGGSIANNDPAADYPSACIALNATIHTNNRKIEAEKFFKGMFETSLKSGEIIEEIEFEIPEEDSNNTVAKRQEDIDNIQDFSMLRFAPLTNIYDEETSIVDNTEYFYIVDRMKDPRPFGYSSTEFGDTNFRHNQLVDIPQRKWYFGRIKTSMIAVNQQLKVTPYHSVIKKPKDFRLIKGYCIGSLFRNCQIKIINFNTNVEIDEVYYTDEWGYFEIRTVNIFNT